MKIMLKFFLMAVIITFTTPVFIHAGEVDIDQVRKTVRHLSSSVKEGQPSISARKLKQILGSNEKFVLLDVRTAAEFEAGHIPGALNISRGRIEWLIPEIIKKTDRAIYVYSRTGERSGFATERLLEMGYSKVFHVKDGFRGWLQSGFSIYNRHGEFVLVHGGFEKREPTLGQ